MSFISIENVVKTYTRGTETLKVLNGLSLKIEQGEFVALMGPSGSGKSTLLNFIGGIDTPNSGTVKVGDDNLSSLSANQLTEWRSNHVGFIFQFYNLIPVLTAFENVELPLGLLKMSNEKKKQQVEQVLQLVNLSDRKDHYPNQLSGGQQQRVAIARAVATDPTVIVADEPTGDLDRNSADEILKLMTRLNKELGKTIVMVTHDPHAAGYASKRFHLEKGELTEDK
ncbi:MAG: ABC transporter ATP-binding protein [Chloroherpetonaceae bacterium]|nr:ABC transporter ATP-binding protein [Chloroherpetonaceae bacterium]